MECKVCGEDTAERIKRQSSVKERFGSRECYVTLISKCSVCKSEIDDTPDEDIMDAINRSKKTAVIEMITHLKKTRDTEKLIDIELALGLRPFGVIETWLKFPEKVSHGEYALLEMLQIAPEAINILDCMET